MKIKALFLALFVAGLAASIAVAKPPPGKGNGHGKDKGTGDTPAAVSTTGGSTTTGDTPAATVPTSGKVLLCHRTGKPGKWVRISIPAKPAKKRIAKGDVWLQDASATCADAAKPKGDDDSTTTTTGTATTAGTTTTPAPATTTTTP